MGLFDAVKKKLIVFELNKLIKELEMNKSQYTVLAFAAGFLGDALKEFMAHKEGIDFMNWKQVIGAFIMAVAFVAAARINPPRDPREMNTRATDKPVEIAPKG
jgi:hypothetical protein